MEKMTIFTETIITFQFFYMKS